LRACQPEFGPGWEMIEDIVGLAAVDPGAILSGNCAAVDKICALRGEADIPAATLCYLSNYINDLDKDIVSYPRFYPRSD